MRSITSCRLIMPEVHSFMADTTSARAIISQGGTLPGIRQVVSIVVEVVVDLDDVVVLVEDVDVVVVLVDVVVVEDVVVVDVVVVSVSSTRILLRNTPVSPENAAKSFPLYSVIE